MPCISRIGRLLQAEFLDLNEPILAESPFTEVTPEGLGVKQYHIGLTSSKLLFASDNFDALDLKSCECGPSPVPECQTLCLVKMMPLYEIQVRFCAHNGRHIMDISSENEKNYKISLEMGGHLYKTFLWHTFCTQISCLQYFIPKCTPSRNEFCFSENSSELTTFFSFMNDTQSNIKINEDFSFHSEIET